MKWAGLKNRQGRYHRRKKTSARNHEWQLHCAALAKAESPAIFDRLATQLNEYVAAFNAARSTADVRCEIGVRRVEIVKEQPYPSSTS